MSQRPTPPRGMRDILPAQSNLRRHLINSIFSAYFEYGFTEIETPILEDYKRLSCSNGGENVKLMYKVLRRGIGDSWPPESEERAVDLAMRYDLTVPLCRYYSSNEPDLPRPFKSIQFGPVFRAERPQKGRYRQFNQCDIDIIADDGLLSEIELICATTEALERCGLSGVVTRVNDRRILDALLDRAGFKENEKSSALIAIDKFDKVGADGVEKELGTLNNAHATKAIVELLTSINEAVDSAEKLRLISDIDAADAIKNVSEIINGVSKMKASAEAVFDPMIVRGMGYYTGSIFELSSGTYPLAMGGGGRYDDLVENLSGIKATAVGLSIGFERLADLLENADLFQDERIVCIYSPKAPLDRVSTIVGEQRRGGQVISSVRAVKNRAAQLNRCKADGFLKWFEINDEGTAGELMDLK